MPKKRRSRAARRPASRHGQPRGASRSDLDAYRIGTALERLGDPFDEWAGKESVGLTFDDLREPLQFAFGGLGALGPVEVTGWDAGHVRAMFEDYLPELPLDVDAVSGLATAMHVFAAFLQDTGRWTRMDLQLYACVAVLGQVLSAAEQVTSAHALREAMAQEVPAASELDALEALPVVGRLSTLLEWVGPGRTVTATGALRLADTVAAAGLLGVRVRRVGSSRSPHQQRLDIDDDDCDDDAPLIRSMWEVDVLGAGWTALHEAGLVHVGAHRATPTERARAWTSDDVTSRLDVRRDAVAAFLAVTLRHRAAQGWYQEQAVAAVVAALTALVSGLPVDLAHLEAAAGEVTGSEADLVAGLIRTELERAAAEGLLELAPLGVPNALVPALAAGLLRVMEAAPAGGGPAR